MRVVVAAETTRAYAAVCALGQEISVANHSLAVVSHEADITVKRHEAGANSDFDVARAQALVAEVRSTIPVLEGQRHAALFELTALLGRTPAQAPNDLINCVNPPHLVALIPVGDGSELIKRRPDVRQADRRLAAATAKIGVATADLYPAVSLVGFYGGAAVQLSQLNTNEGRIWGVGPSISWSFPNMAAPRAKVRQAKAEQTRLRWHPSMVSYLTRSKRPNKRSRCTARRWTTVRRSAMPKPRCTQPSAMLRINSAPVRSVIWTCSRRNNPWSRLMPRSPHPMRHWYKTKLRYSRLWGAAGEVKVSPFDSVRRMNPHHLSSTINEPQRKMMLSWKAVVFLCVASATSMAADTTSARSDDMSMPAAAATEWLNVPPQTAVELTRQGRCRSILDLHLHQLAKDTAIHQGVGCEIPRTRTGSDRGAHARV